MLRAEYKTSEYRGERQNNGLIKYVPCNTHYIAIEYSGGNTINIRKEFPSVVYQKTVKVFDHAEFVYQIQKTRINAAGGAEQLVKTCSKPGNEYILQNVVEKALEYCTAELQVIYL